jgi:predicted GNAT family N-acyltransferase
LNVKQSPSRIHLEPAPLSSFCREVSFAPGDLLRTKGKLSVDMYVLTAGEVEVSLGAADHAASVIVADLGAPIGEIGFLTGVPATATVKARSNVTALYIDNVVWRRLERERPEFAAGFYRQLAEVAEGRQSCNVLFEEPHGKPQPERALNIIICQRADQLLEAQRIRYQIYCEELGRTSPYADASKRLIKDELDETGHVLLALEEGVPVATLRMNMAREGRLDVLEDLYGMKSSPHHPQNTGVCTKFIVKKANRLGQASFKLMSTAVDMAQRYAIKDCYIDCIPELKPFYMSLGFAQSAPPFLHRENGRSIPMRLDIERYAKRISRLANFVVG